MTFEPDWAVHPGEVLLEMLEERGITQANLAARCELSVKHVNQLCNGKVRLSAPVAVKIERALDARCALLLMRMQAAHDVWKAQQCD